MSYAAIGAALLLMVVALWHAEKSAVQYRAIAFACVSIAMAILALAAKP